MDFDIKRFISAMALIVLIWVGWHWYSTRYAPQPTEPDRTTRRPEPPAPAPTDVEEAPAVAPAPGWRVVRPDDGPTTEVILGARAVEDGGYKAEISIDPVTAALNSVLLSEFKLHVDDEHTGYPLLATGRPDRGRTARSFMLGTMALEGRTDQFDLAAGCWKPSPVDIDPCGVQTVYYTATIADEEGKPALTFVKTYRYRPESYSLNFTLSVVNHSDDPVQMRSLDLYGPAGIMREDPRSDRRSASVAYASTESDYKLSKVDMRQLTNAVDRVAIPREAGRTLQWLAATNKFFGAVMRPIPLPEHRRAEYLASAPIEAQRLTMADPARPDAELDTLGLSAEVSMEKPLAPGQRVDYHFEVYLGPLDKHLFDTHYAGHNYEKLIPVSSCAFAWLVFGLLGILNALYALVGNYGIAIIVLVLLVRLVMHPITKKSQVSMMKFSRLTPKIKELQKKYANNREELSKQTMALYKDAGANPVLGCLPMALQMPIWFALYSAVDTVAIRHKGLLPAGWHWLTDLSAPDRLIPFSWFGVAEPVQVPLVGGLDAINLLPILLCIAMVLQAKLSPQADLAKADPQQAAQQKMMMIMMPAMMLVFLFNAPSGLNLYIMASMFGSIIEQYYIRKHFREKHDSQSEGAVATTKKIGGKFEPKQRKPRPPQRYM